ncbi:hypothetical protein FGO68_gene380 [Halteria grandinella]|uniref:Uncharacterized protein n=1 Tax=Halteria grandinella TaxID=5974 RepID=A0A8J8SYV1_HALGN|nr:hypothetical protein FGO68_gene380 [Halteria grandinella]
MNVENRNFHIVATQSIRSITEGSITIITLVPYMSALSQFVICVMCENVTLLIADMPRWVARDHWATEIATPMVQEKPERQNMPSDGTVSQKVEKKVRSSSRKNLQQQNKRGIEATIIMLSSHFAIPCVIMDISWGISMDTVGIYDIVPIQQVSALSLSFTFSCPLTMK